MFHDSHCFSSILLLGLPPRSLSASLNIRRMSVANLCRTRLWSNVLGIRTLCTSRKLAKNESESEHRYQYNYDLFSLHPEEEHYLFPLLTGEQLSQSKMRPRSVRMLTRDFIYDSLYNPHYGYFSRQAVLLPSFEQSPSEKASFNTTFPFNDIKDETEFMRIVQLRYMAFEEHVRKEREGLEKRLHKNEPTLQERIDALMAEQKKTAWGSAERLNFAREIGRLQRDQANEQVSDAEVDAMVASQVWHTPTQLFSPYYGRALARYLVAEYKLHLFPFHDLVIFELGGGAGTLALDILDYIREFESEVYERTRYNIVEISARLASQQRSRLMRHVQNGTVQVIHRDFLHWDEDVDEPCFVVALEVLDNLPHDVVRYSTDDLKPYQGIISIDKTGDFAELWEPVQDPLIQRYLNLFASVRRPLLPPGAPFYLSWIPQWLRHTMHKEAPFYPNLTQPHFIPTGALQMLDVLKKHFPLHRLVFSDFSSLPDTIKGVNAPVVQTRHNGVMIPVTTYCVLQGFFDIFFPTDFVLLRDMYLCMMGTNADADGTGHDKLWGDNYFTSTYFAELGSRRDSIPYENYALPAQLMGLSDIIPPPLVRDSHDTRIMSHAEFLNRYADTQGTELKDGTNPMVSWYANACWLLT